MSGGHWAYQQHQMREVLENVSEAPFVNARFPQLAERLRELTPDLYQIVHDLDYDISGDTGIRDDRAFEEAALAKLGTRRVQP